MVGKWAPECAYRNPGPYQQQQLGAVMVLLSYQRIRFRVGIPAAGIGFQRPASAVTLTTART